MIEQLALAVILTRVPVDTQSAAAPVEASAVVESDLLVRYRFSNPMFDISLIDLSVSGTGRGRLTWTRRDVAKPQSRDIVLSEKGLAELRDLLTLLNFVNSTEDYQTKEGHPNLGETRIRVDQAGTGREVVFNYTKNREAATLGQMLRGVANREMYVAELEVAILHQPLETPALIATLAREFKLGRIGDAVALLPLLRRVADDSALPLIARNKAAELILKIQPEP